MISIPGKQISHSTFAPIWFPAPLGRDEKGNRCESGAIPVAVRPEDGKWKIENGEWGCLLSHFLFSILHFPLFVDAATTVR